MVNRKKAPRASRGFFVMNPGDVLLSHAVPHAVPSALKSLTAVFGMGTGVASSLSPPETLLIKVQRFKGFPIQSGFRVVLTGNTVCIGKSLTLKASFLCAFVSSWPNLYKKRNTGNNSKRY